MKKMIISSILTIALLGLVTGCSGTQTENNDAASTTDQTTVESAQEGEDVTITFFSNLTDRSNGQGLIEQKLIDMYVEEHPNVKIQLETLDDNSYQTKFKAYITSNEVPDISTTWLTNSWMEPILEAGIYEPIDAAKVEEYNFADGSLDLATKDGNIYALSRNTDAWVFYYNKDLFAEYNVEVPTTYEDLLKVGKVFKDAGIIPVSMAGAEGWTDSKWIMAYLGQVGGTDTSKNIKESAESAEFDTDFWKESLNLAKDTAAELFDYGFETCDYATSQNLFVNGQAAMWWMGSWEMSVQTDFEVGAFAMPSLNSGKDGALLAYSGAGYAVSSSSEHKDIAMDILLFIFKPENWSKLCWENGICMSAQDFYNYTSGNETPVQKDILNVFSNAKVWTGADYAGMGSLEMESSYCDGALALLAGLSSPEEYIEFMKEVAVK